MQELYEHAVRLLREHSMSGKQWDYTMELVSYAVSFGSFFLSLIHISEPTRPY